MPRSRFETLVDALLSFYRLDLKSESDFLNILKISRNSIVQSPLDYSPREIESTIQENMLKYCTRANKYYLRGPLSEISKQVQVYSHLFYQSIFIEYCEAERGILVSRFSDIETACVAIMRYRLSPRSYR